ncbi:MAG TPA: septum formation inhibitor Maf, partial [Alphaproteobacteria bacterium]|nr:septum formation inhibitor Maf [Alphaproteobacteria bacterium]
DTVVACGRRILPKAETEEQARMCLELLSGRRHQVLTGLAVIAADGAAR